MERCIIFVNLHIFKSLGSGIGNQSSWKFAGIYSNSKHPLLMLSAGNCKFTVIESSRFHYELLSGIYFIAKNKTKPCPQNNVLSVLDSLTLSVESRSTQPPHLQAGRIKQWLALCQPCKEVYSENIYNKDYWNSNLLLQV